MHCNTQHQPERCSLFNGSRSPCALSTSIMPQSKNVLRRVRTKRASKCDLKNPLEKYMKRVYGDHIAQEAHEALEELQDMRSQIVSAGTSTALAHVRIQSEDVHRLCLPRLL